MNSAAFLTERGKRSATPFGRPSIYQPLGAVSVRQGLTRTEFFTAGRDGFESGATAGRFGPAVLSDSRVASVGAAPAEVTKSQAVLESPLINLLSLRDPGRRSAIQGHPAIIDKKKPTKKLPAPPTT
jgi:hypothetical protein